MTDKDYNDMAQNASDQVRKTANDTADTVKDYASKARDTAQDYAGRARDAAQDYANRGYEATRDYTDTGMKMAGQMSENLRDFVRNDPWIAIMSAFAVGYVLARMMRKV
jgi:ElaB/YqjD/DUF883 family membrane-anchored ribosome-binding protein